MKNSSIEETHRRIQAAALANSEELDLSGLGLTEIPEELSTLGQLKVLRLRGPASQPFHVNSAIDDNGARALAALTGLTFLDLSNNQIGPSGAQALASLGNLTRLDLGSNRIGIKGAEAIGTLSNLTWLNLGYNHICADGAQMLTGLRKLTTLGLARNNIGANGAQALASLINLTGLDLRSNSIGPVGAQSLAGLSGLEWLDLSHAGMILNYPNYIGDHGAQALSGLVKLTQLGLSHNKIGVEGVKALTSLTNLTKLHLESNEVGAEGVQALAKLTNLTHLGLYGTQIGSNGAYSLTALVNLVWLDLSHSGVTDLSPLLNLTKLSELHCEGCQLIDPVPELWMRPSLGEVRLSGAKLPGVPEEFLHGTSGESCLEKLRAHFDDLKAGESEVTDIKLMILGNGRVGKTQIARRLLGEAYNEAVSSTHGIQVKSAPLVLSDSATVTLKIWDFGGQDIYHGTHALFLESRVVYSLVWTTESEELKLHKHGGFTFRNQPLGYWLAYARFFGGPQSPVLLIQTQCEGPEDERMRPPVADDALADFPFKKLLHYSAKFDRGRAALNEALAEAARWLRSKHGIDKIGRGRAEVKSRLEKMYAEGKQLITQAEFCALCTTVGNISSPPLLLDYLHSIGAVFYRHGLFGEDIILDQAWALDAVYAVFDRESKAFKNIKRDGGRFRLSDLAEWVWRKHGEAEQELFLSFMQQCGICFVIRKGEGDIETEYIAPDLLPQRNDPEITSQLRQKWDDRHDAETTLIYELLPPGFMCSLISQIGAEAGLAAEYWRDGFYFYDEETGCKVLVEQRWTEGWAGEIRVRAQGKQAELLRERVLTIIDGRHTMFGAGPADRPRRIERATIERDDSERGAAMIKPAHEPANQPEFYISYAWGDETPEGRQREAFVDQVCDAATARGIIIVRDKTAMRFGDQISKFMARIGKAARDSRVFIILSEKYLKSPYCMYELFDVWRNCREEDTEFIAHTRVFVMPCAKIATPMERAHHSGYWRERFEELHSFVQKNSSLNLSDKDHADYRRMIRFASETANILTLVQDALRPRSFDEFKSYAFDDPPKVKH